jgi:hypothetical protein
MKVVSTGLNRADILQVTAFWRQLTHPYREKDSIHHRKVTVDTHRYSNF